MQRPWRSEAEDLRLDLDEVLADLDPDLQAVWALLRGRMRIGDIALEMGVSRATVNRYCQRLRIALQSRGFGEYLRLS